jgi:LacI family transcriptional regulator
MMPCIALVVRLLGEAYVRELVLGACRRLRAEPGFEIMLWPADSRDLRDFDHRRCAGVLLSSGDPEHVRLVSRLPLPVVQMLGQNCPVRVVADDPDIGRRAARYLRREWLQVAVAPGSDSDLWGRSRAAGFLAEARRLGLPTLPTPRRAATAAAMHSGADDPFLRGWLSDLPPGTGIFAVSHHHGQHVLRMVRQTTRTLPGELGLIVAGDDPMVCEVESPSLSAVHVPCTEIGERSADLLLSWIASGKPPVPPIVQVASSSLIERDSTARGTSEQRLVARAQAVLAAHLADPPTITQLADRLGVAKRTLELAYRRVLGVSPAQAHLSARLARAQTLLAEDPEASLAQISTQTGFSAASALARAFRRYTGQTPGAYRRSRGRATGRNPANGTPWQPPHGPL